MYTIIHIFESYLVWPLPFTIPMIILANSIWKTQSFNFAIQFFRIVILVNWLQVLLHSLIISEELGINLGRATGGYWWAYFSMLFFSIFLPAILFFPKIGKNKWALFAISILTNLSLFFQLFILIYTSLSQRDYLPTSLSIASFKMILLKAFILALFLVGIELIFFKKGTAEESPPKNDEILDQSD